MRSDREGMGTTVLFYVPGNMKILKPALYTIPTE